MNCSNKYYNIIAAYVLAITLSLAILTWIMQLWRADLSIPFYQDWDANFFQMTIKGMMDNGWYQSNVFLGAPESQYLYDFPFASNLDMILIKLISLFVSTYPLILNIYLLITFPLITITSMIDRLYPHRLAGNVLFRREGVADPQGLA